MCNVLSNSSNSVHMHGSKLFEHTHAGRAQRVWSVCMYYKERCARCLFGVDGNEGERQRRQRRQERRVQSGGGQTDVDGGAATNRVLAGPNMCECDARGSDSVWFVICIMQTVFCLFVGFIPSAPRYISHVNFVNAININRQRHHHRHHNNVCLYPFVHSRHWDLLLLLW